MRTLRIFNVSEYVYAGASVKETNSFKRVPKYFGGVIEMPDGSFGSKVLPTGGISFTFNTLVEHIIRVKNGEQEIACFCVDKTPTVKKAMYKDLCNGYDGYKATRKPKPIKTKIQLDAIESLLLKHTPNVYSSEGYEADDWIATIVNQYEADFDRVIIHTRDSDLFSLVSEKTSIACVGSRGKEINCRNYAQMVRDNKDNEIPYNGILIDKLLRGDSSDNIPSVRNEIKQAINKIPLYLYPRFNNLEYLRETVDNYTMYDTQTVKLLDIVAPTIINEKVNLYDEGISASLLNATAVLIGNKYARSDMNKDVEYEEVRNILEVYATKYMEEMEGSFYG